MKLGTYLAFNGNCAEAFDFYQKALGGTIGEKHTYGASPMAEQVGPAMADKIMHVSLQVGGQESLMGCDSPEPQAGFKGFNMIVAAENVEEAERVFAALSEKGNVTMPMAQTFWAARFGMVLDQFGVMWAVNCEAAA